MKIAFWALLISMSLMCVSAQHSTQYYNYPDLEYNSFWDWYPNAGFDNPSLWAPYPIEEHASQYDDNSFTLDFVSDGCTGPIHVLFGPTPTFTGNTNEATLHYEIAVPTTNANSRYSANYFGTPIVKDDSAPLFAFDRPNSIRLQITSDGVWTVRVEDVQGNVMVTNGMACNVTVPLTSIKWFTFGATQSESQATSQCDLFLPMANTIFANNFKPNYPNTNELPSNCPASKLPCYCAAPENPKPDCGSHGSKPCNHNGPKNGCGHNGNNDPKDDKSDNNCGLLGGILNILGLGKRH